MNCPIHVHNIVAAVETIVGHPLNKEEGIKFGSADAPVSRALVCWMATAEALLEAERIHAELVITHESAFYPYDAELNTDSAQEWESWETNRRRLDVLKRGNLTLVRMHSSVDELCIFDEFALRLGLGKDYEGDEWHKVYNIAPTSFSDLVESVKRAIGMEHVRVSCAPTALDKTVKRIGLPCGGMGLFVNVSYQHWAIEQGCDALIAGESDSYGFRFSAECGVPMIETSHEASEIPGMRRFTKILQQACPNVAFTFFDNHTAWRWM